MRQLLFIYCLVYSFFLPVSAEAESVNVESAGDVKFVVVGKTTNHRQVTEGVYALLNYHFFAEIFLKDGGQISDAKLILSENSDLAMNFEGEYPALEAHGGRYTSEQELNKAYPDGKYTFSYAMSDGQHIEQAVMLENSSDKTRIPFPVVIYLSQDGVAVKPSMVDSNKDLDVSWSPFESGAVDSNNIVDDLIFVVTGDCHANRIDHSGGPFADSPYLTFSAEKYTIPSKALFPGESFQLFVEHAEMDTSLHNETPGIATYAATTFLDFQTLGEPLEDRSPCADIMPAMDGGQTDRPKVKQVELSAVEAAL